MADTRQRILDVAQTLFTELGYDGTSLRSIAEEIGITKAALYYYFPSKEALLDALISPTFDFLRGVMPRLLQSTDVDDWGDPLGEVADWLVDQQQLFALVRRNQGVITQLAQNSESFAHHEDIHQAFDTMASNGKVPLENRVRLVCAVALATSLVEVGDAFIGESPDDLRRILRALIAAVLHAEVPAPAAAG